MNIETLFLSITVVIVIMAIWIMWSSIIGAVYVPTPMDIVGKMLEIAEVNENDTLIDLGSGDGRIILEAAKTFDANSIGVEADPLRVFWSRTRIKLNELEEKVEVIWGNFFRTDLSKATVVTVYQGQGINNKLRTKFIEELYPGTRVVSYSFTFDGWEPLKKDPDSDVYLYII